MGEMIVNHSFTSYDTISMTGISAINDLTEYIGRVSRLNAEDTSGMTEEELEKHAEKTKEAVADMLGQFAMLRGIPYTNLKKQVNAVDAWIDTFKNWNKEGVKTGTRRAETLTACRRAPQDSTTGYTMRMPAATQWRRRRRWRS